MRLIPSAPEMDGGHRGGAGETAGSLQSIFVGKLSWGVLGRVSGSVDTRIIMIPEKEAESLTSDGREPRLNIDSEPTVPSLLSANTARLLVWPSPCTLVDAVFCSAEQSTRGQEKSGL